MIFTRSRLANRNTGYRLGARKNWKLSQLEQRLMMAADAGVAVEVATLSQVATSSPIGASTVGETSSASTTGAVVFIDARVEDWNSLTANVDASATIVLIDPSQDAIEIISSTLAALQQPADSIHLVCHGQSGQLQLGAEVIDAESLSQSKASLQKWSTHLRDGADIMVYGCNVASQQQGQVFIQTLASLTGLDVAASTNRTGSIDGSDWNLEYNIGTIQSLLAFDATTRERYTETLNIVINARGQTGQERFNLRIDNEIVATYGASKGWAQFEYETNQSLTGDQIRIEFINDAYDPANNFDRNLFVNNIQVNGQNYETYHPNTFSTGTWLDEDGIVSGFGRGRVLHTNGYFQFAEDDTPPTVSTIVVNAKGDEGDEQFVLVAGTRRFDPITVGTGTQSYEFRLDNLITVDLVRIEFVNDLYDPAAGVDRNLTVDNIIIDGAVYETEAPEVLGSGVWDPGAGFLRTGHFQTETLHGTGFFQYDNGSSNPSGYVLDTTLAHGGIRMLGIGEPETRAFRALDGTIAAINSGYRSQGPDEMVKFVNDLEMTLANGQPDTSYGPGGLVEITPLIDSFSDSPGSRYSWINDVAIDTQGRVVLIGSTLFGTDEFTFQESFIIRVTADGQLDTSFAANGYSAAVASGEHELAIDGSDRIVLAGPQSWNRLDANGNLDLSFGSGGIVDLEGVGDDYPYSGTDELIALPDGSTLTLAHSSLLGPDSTASVIKLDANGSLDTNFGVQGVANVPNSPYFYEMVLDNQGRIVIGGEQALRRFTSSGQIDDSFGGGLVELPSLVVDRGLEHLVEVNSVAIDSQGRVLFANSLSTLVGRINADGSFDTTLSDDGFQLLTTGFNTSFKSIFVDANDRLVTVGDDEVENGLISFYRFV